MTAIFVVMIAVFLIALASPDNASWYEAPQQRSPPSHFESQHWEKNHFIDKHLHRNDEKHARHKRNQTPW